MTYRFLLKTLLAVALGTTAMQAFAARNVVTLIEMGDLHGTLVPHAAILKDPDGSERPVASSGGLARLKTVVDDIRKDNPEAVLLSTGDLTHGSAEAMFTVGDAMMIPMNAFGIDVFTPATGTSATVVLYSVIVLQALDRSQPSRVTFVPCPVISVVMMYLLSRV